jgi:sec-independent protein translocase protein TatB
MFDLGWTELLLIGIVALIVVGPKDLPILFRNVGQFVGKAKGMAREFSRAMNDAADDSGVRTLAKDLNKTLKTATNPVGSALDGVKSAASSLADIDPNSETGKLSAEREEQAKKIRAASARSAADRKMKEAQEAQAKAAELEAETKPRAKAAPAAESET